MPRSPVLRPRLWTLISLLSAALISNSCTYLLLVAPALVATGGTATYVLELFNDELTGGSAPIYTVAHVPSTWLLSSATFTSTAPPLSGTGVQVADPGLVCEFGSTPPPPGAGRQAVFVFWGNFTNFVNPQTGTGHLNFAVGQTEGTFDVDFYFVFDTACSGPVGATTQVEQPIFTDGFETGNLNNWSSQFP